MTGRPPLAALAVVLRGGDLLLVMRRNPPDAELWGFPGGHVERGETIGACAVRELVEETGVRAEPGPLLGLIEVMRAEHHFVLAAVLCTYVAGEPAAADDALDAAWIGAADVRAGRVRCSRHVAEIAARALKAPAPAPMLLDAERGLTG